MTVKKRRNKFLLCGGGSGGAVSPKGSSSSLSSTSSTSSEIVKIRLGFSARLRIIWRRIIYCFLRRRPKIYPNRPPSIFVAEDRSLSIIMELPEHPEPSETQIARSPRPFSPGVQRIIERLNAKKKLKSQSSSKVSLQSVWSLSDNPLTVPGDISAQLATSISDMFDSLSLQSLEDSNKLQDQIDQGHVENSMENVTGNEISIRVPRIEIFLEGDQRNKEVSLEGHQGNEEVLLERDSSIAEYCRNNNAKHREKPTNLMSSSASFPSTDSIGVNFMEKTEWRTDTKHMDESRMEGTCKSVQFHNSVTVYANPAEISETKTEHVETDKSSVEVCLSDEQKAKRPATPGTARTEGETTSIAWNQDESDGIMHTQKPDYTPRSPRHFMKKSKNRTDHGETTLSLPENRANVQITKTCFEDAKEEHLIKADTHVSIVNKMVVSGTEDAKRSPSRLNIVVDEGNTVSYSRRGRIRLSTERLPEESVGDVPDVSVIQNDQQEMQDKIRRRADRKKRKEMRMAAEGYVQEPDRTLQDEADQRKTKVKKKAICKNELSETHENLDDTIEEMTHDELVGQEKIKKTKSCGQEGKEVSEPGVKDDLYRWEKMKVDGDIQSLLDNGELTEEARQETKLEGENADDETVVGEVEYFTEEENAKKILYKGKSKNQNTEQIHDKGVNSDDESKERPSREERRKRRAEKKKHREAMAAEAKQDMEIFVLPEKEKIDEIVGKHGVTSLDLYAEDGRAENSYQEVENVEDDKTECMRNEIAEILGLPFNSNKSRNEEDDGKDEKLNKEKVHSDAETCVDKETRDTNFKTLKNPENIDLRDRMESDERKVNSNIKTKMAVLNVTCGERIPKQKYRQKRKVKIQNEDQNSTVISLADAPIVEHMLDDYQSNVDEKLAVYSSLDFVDNINPAVSARSAEDVCQKSTNVDDKFKSEEIRKPPYNNQTNLETGEEKNSNRTACVDMAIVLRHNDKPETELSATNTGSENQEQMEDDPDYLPLIGEQYTACSKYVSMSPTEGKVRKPNDVNMPGKVSNTDGICSSEEVLSLVAPCTPETPYRIPEREESPENYSLIVQQDTPFEESEIGECQQGHVTEHSYYENKFSRYLENRNAEHDAETLSDNEEDEVVKSRHNGGGYWRKVSNENPASSRSERSKSVDRLSPVGCDVDLKLNGSDPDLELDTAVKMLSLQGNDKDKCRYIYKMVQDTLKDTSPPRTPPSDQSPRSVWPRGLDDDQLYPIEYEVSEDEEEHWSPRGQHLDPPPSRTAPLTNTMYLPFPKTNKAPRAAQTLAGMKKSLMQREQPKAFTANGQSEVRTLRNDFSSISTMSIPCSIKEEDESEEHEGTRDLDTGADNSTRDPASKADKHTEKSDTKDDKSTLHSDNDVAFPEPRDELAPNVFEVDKKNLPPVCGVQKEDMAPPTSVEKPGYNPLLAGVQQTADSIAENIRPVTKQKKMEPIQTSTELDGILAQYTDLKSEIEYNMALSEAQEGNTAQPMYHHLPMEEISTEVASGKQKRKTKDGKDAVNTIENTYPPSTDFPENLTRKQQAHYEKLKVTFRAPEKNLPDAQFWKDINQDKTRMSEELFIKTPFSQILPNEFEENQMSPIKAYYEKAEPTQSSPRIGHRTKPSEAEDGGNVHMNSESSDDYQPESLSELRNKLNNLCDDKSDMLTESPESPTSRMAFFREASSDPRIWKSGDSEITSTSRLSAEVLSRITETAAGNVRNLESYDENRDEVEQLPEECIDTEPSYAPSLTDRYHLRKEENLDFFRQFVRDSQESGPTMKVDEENILQTFARTDPGVHTLDDDTAGNNLVFFKTVAKYTDFYEPNSETGESITMKSKSGRRSPGYIPDDPNNYISGTVAQQNLEFFRTVARDRSFFRIPEKTHDSDDSDQESAQAQESTCHNKQQRTKPLSSGKRKASQEFSEWRGPDSLQLQSPRLSERSDGTRRLSKGVSPGKAKENMDFFLQISKDPHFYKCVEKPSISCSALPEKKPTSSSSYRGVNVNSGRPIGKQGLGFKSRYK